MDGAPMEEVEAGEPSWWVYIVRCRDGSLYTGITTDPDRRVREHNDGTGARYTAGRAPVRLVYLEVHDDRSAASKREYEIKQRSRRRKEALVAAYASGA